MKHGARVGNERGAAMVIALLALVLLTLVGTLFLAQTKTETQISGHDQRATQALMHAEAGYGEVLARLADVRDTTNYIGQTQHGDWNTSPGWGRYVVLANGNSSQDINRNRTATDGLDNDGDGSIDESSEWYPELLSRQGADAINYPWAQVHYKLNGANQVILYGDHDFDIATPNMPNLARGYPMIVVTAYGGQGSARRTVEVEAVKPPFQMIDSAIYAEDDDFTFNGTQFLVSGRDWDPVTGDVVLGNPEVSGILTIGDPSNLTDGLNSQQTNNVEGDGAEPSVASSPVDLDLAAIREAYLPLTEYEVAPGTYSGINWGDLDHYTVVHCPGDLHISGTTVGGGILIIDGDFELSGGFTWYGVVLLMGDLRFTGGGAEIHIYGSCLSQGEVAGQTISGNADVLYSSEALSRLTALSPYIVYNWREL